MDAEFFRRGKGGLEKVEMKGVSMTYPTDVATAADGIRYIGTWGLSTCGGLSLYDPENKVGGVAHVMFFEDQFGDFADSLLEDLERVGGRRYAAHVFNMNGWVINATPEKMEANRKSRQAYAEAVLKSCSEVERYEFRDETAFVLDTATGEIIPLRWHVRGKRARLLVT